MSCSTKTRVKVLKPGDLEGARSLANENSEYAGEGKAENGRGYFVLSRLFNCGTKSKKTRVIEVRSSSPAVS